jgi:thiosulfate/3-mercaptopyruvate sulfurtransferase
MRTRHVFRHAVVTIAIGLLVSCTSVGSRPAVKAPATIDSLVSTQWLSEHLDEPDLVVLDCTVRVERGQDGGFKIISGRADFESGHIPTAGFADLTGDVADGSKRYLFAVAPPEQFAAAMGALGVGDDSRVVLYSGNDPGWAARVWWMLRWIGFDRAALLDGGLKAWKAEGRPLSTALADRPARRLTVSLRPELIADRDQVRAALGNRAVTLVDSLPEASFQGKFALYGRPGHIPGAINIPATSLVDESGRYLPQAKLAAMHGGDLGRRFITYCGGGIAASSSAFVMTRLGFTNVAVYTASLQEWAADPANPMEVSTPE